MPEEQVVTLYPKDQVDIDAETDTGSLIADQLDKGRHVTVGKNGWIIDVWDPVTLKLYDEDGNEIGRRSRPFHPPEMTEIRETGYLTYTAEKGDIPGYIDMTGDGLGLFTNKTFERLGNDAEITIDPKGNVIEIRDPKTNKLYKEVGGQLVEFGTRATPFPAHVAKKEIRSPLVTTFFPADKDEFSDDTSIWYCLSQGWQVTLDDRGMIIDIWDPEQREVLNVNGGELADREDPFPSDNNIANTKLRYEALLREIAALRQAARKQEGAVKSATQSMIAVKLREYGQLVWLYGRLLNRKRRRDKKFELQRTGSTVPQKQK